MRLLLDTHALVWWWEGSSRLPDAAKSAIADEDNEVIVSAVTAWEISNKYRVGKWPDVAHYVDGFADKVALSRFTAMPVDFAHARLAGSLPDFHRDPFDRLLAAQCLIEAATLVSNDALLSQFGVRILWAGPLH